MLSNIDYYKIKGLGLHYVMMKKSFSSFLA